MIIDQMLSSSGRSLLLALGPTALLLSCLALPACECGKPDEKAKPEPLMSPKPTRRPLRAKQRVSQKNDMREIAKVVEEMKRRARGKISMDAPARRILALMAKLPVDSYPATYMSFLDDIKDRLETLRKSTRYQKDYNGMVEACLACHKIFAPQVMIPLEKLKLK